MAKALTAWSLSDGASHSVIEVRDCARESMDCSVCASTALTPVRLREEREALKNVAMRTSWADDTPRKGVWGEVAPGGGAILGRTDVELGREYEGSEHGRIGHEIETCWMLLVA